MTQVYNENSIRTLNYRESARESLGMYIGSNDINGMHHLLTEIVANSMDEAAAGYGKHIAVQIDRLDNRAYVIDEGRGIPFKKNAEGKWAIIEMCTNMHSGGKFSGQGNYKSSLGLNGVGATVTNALSKEFGIAPRRVASLMDTTSCFVQGIIPYGAQILMAAGLAHITPVAIIPNLYYPAFIGAMVVVSILLQLPKCNK